MRTFRSAFNWPKPDGFSAAKDHYLFEAESTQAIAKLQTALNNSMTNSDPGRTIAITGERGNGKTTFLRYLQERIDEKIPDLYVLPIINPSIFDTRLSLLEVLLATIKSDISHLDDEKYFIEREGLLIKISDIGSTIEQLRISRTTAATSLAPDDYVESATSITEIATKLDELFSTYLAYRTRSAKQAHQRLVLMIDDLDLISNIDIQQAWSDIQNILSQTSLILILSYRESQLQTALLAPLLDQNKTLLKHNEVNLDELRGQVNAKLNKQIPEQQRIRLKPVEELMKLPLDQLLTSVYKNTSDFSDLQDCLAKILGSDLSLKQHLSAMEWFDLFFLLRLDLRWHPISEFEQVRSLYPSSLRELMNFFDLIVAIADQEETAHSTPLENQLQIRINNLHLVKNYVLQLGRNHLPAELALVLNRIDESDPSQRNRAVYVELFELEKNLRLERYRFVNQPRRYAPVDYYTETKPIYFHGLELDLQRSGAPVWNERIVSTLTPGNNISLGDVIKIIWMIEMQVSASDALGLFLATLKYLYTIELQVNLLEMLKLRANGVSLDSTNIYLENYIQALNGLIMPAGYNYLDHPIIIQKQSYDSFTLIPTSTIRGLQTVQRIREFESEDNDEDESESSTIYHASMRNFISSLVYSNVTTSSRHGRYNDPDESSGVRIISQSMRTLDTDYFLTSTSNANLIKSRRYPLDPFSIYAKEEHLVTIINGWSSTLMTSNKLVSLRFWPLSEESTMAGIPYLLSDAFDIDILIRANYTRQSQSDLSSEIRYVFRQIPRHLLSTAATRITGSAKYYFEGKIYQRTELNAELSRRIHRPWNDLDMSEYTDDLAQMITGQIQQFEDIAKLFGLAEHPSQLTVAKAILDFLESQFIDESGSSLTLFDREPRDGKLDLGKIWQGLESLTDFKTTPYPHIENVQGDTGSKQYKNRRVQNEILSLYVDLSNYVQTLSSKDDGSSDQ